MEQGLIEQDDEGMRYRRTMMALLQQRELGRTIRQLEEETGLAHVTHKAGESVEGVLKRSIIVGDQRYGVIEKSREFSLVPWRPVLERAIGKSISGIMRDGPIDWTIGGRSRGIGIS